MWGPARKVTTVTAEKAGRPNLEGNQKPYVKRKTLTISRFSVIPDLMIRSLHTEAPQVVPTFSLLKPMSMSAHLPAVWQVNRHTHFACLCCPPCCHLRCPHQKTAAALSQPLPGQIDRMGKTSKALHATKQILPYFAMLRMLVKARHSFYEAPSLLELVRLLQCMLWH